MARSQLLSDVIDEYVAFRRLHYKPGTVTNDQQTLRPMLALVGNIQVRNLTARHVDSLMAHFQSRLLPQTVNGRLWHLSAFFKWCRARRYMAPDYDPMAGRKSAKVIPEPQMLVPEHSFPRLLTGDPLATWDTLHDPSPQAEPLHDRDRMVVGLGLFLFVRASEVKAMRFKHVNLDRGELDVFIRKTGQFDRMAISEELDKELRRWLTHLSELGAPMEPDDFLIPGRTRAIYARTKQRRPDGSIVYECRDPGRYEWHRVMYRPAESIKRSLTASGLPTLEQGLHTCRRSGARALYDRLAVEGHDNAMRIVQAMLHHASIQMTERYLQITPDMVMRNKLFRGVRMYPSQSGNVVPLRRASEG